MVLLHHHGPSRKRPSSHAFVPPFATPTKIPKSTTTGCGGNASHQRGQTDVVASGTAPQTLNSIDKMVSMLADAGCTLNNPVGPPCLPSDPHKLRHHLHCLFSSDASLRSEFLAGFSSYINSSHNLRRVLISSHRDGSGSTRSESLVRVLLLVPSIQLGLQNMLIEKLPEYFDLDIDGPSSSSLDQDVARLILNQFRWLDFLVDSQEFSEKLLQVLSICPLHLKKEIIGSLPEIIGDQNNKTVVDSLELMLQEDSGILVPVLDTFSNLNLDDLLCEQVITIALSCIRTIDAEHMPYLLRFLLLSATPSNARRIISQIREQLKFIGVNTRLVQPSKFKGKSVVDNAEASILDALRSSLRFKNMLCQEILKELKCIEKAGDHKTIDIWLLMLIYMNGEPLQKSVEKIFKKKIIDGCIQEDLFDQCICGDKEFVQDFFSPFLSLSGCLLACKGQKTTKFGIHMYRSLFEEFVDMYSRQEVLGALVTHVGSGVSFEVSSALDTMVLLVSKFSQELIPLSYHINGLLDYLEGFNVENLHKVYEVFSLLALSARSSAESFGSSIANELLMIVRKQISNPDLKYKKMGLIGTQKIVSCLGNANNTVFWSSSQKPNYEEALDLLKTSLDSCKQFPLPSILFYDELTAVLDCKTLHPEIMEWISTHVGELESMFLSDLECGQLLAKDTCCSLEGELWMNLDGDISPINVNILPLVSSSSQSASPLQMLPAKFLLLSVVERLANQGSLGGIDALLGCPIHLPSSKIYSESTWQTLTGQQKQIVCLSLYYAINWIRELLNAFSTQIAGRFDSISQTTKDEITVKLLKRLRNLVFLESLLNNSLKQYPLSLPELYPYVEHSASSFLSQPIYTSNVERKSEDVKTNDSASTNMKRKNRKLSKASPSSDVNGKLRQPTIVDVLRKAGAITSQEVSNEDSSGLSSKGSTSESAGHRNGDSSESVNIDVSAAVKVLEAQRYKFRPLLVDCFSLLALSKNQNSCCPDPAAELPLHLYLLRDLHYKLDYFSPSSKPFSARCCSIPPGFHKITAIEFLSEIRPLFPNLKKLLNSAVYILKEGAESCQEHWNSQSALAGNPDLSNMVVSKSSVSSSVFKETLCCFSKMLNLPDIQMEKLVLSDLLESFQPVKMPDCFFSCMQLIPSPGNLDYLYCGVYSFLEEILDIAINFSFTLASEVLRTLESVVTSVQKFFDKLVEGNGKDIRIGFVQELVPTLHNRLGISAQKFLKHNWDSDNLENGWKNKGEIVQKILHIYLENSDSTSDLLDELARSVLPKVPSYKTKAEDDCHGFPALCSATLVVWYRVMHEKNLGIINKLVEEVVISKKSRAGFQVEIVERILKKLQQSVNVVVSLVNMCRTHDKVSVHAMAVKYGGKFVDSFLKVFDFLQTQFQMHNELIIKLVTELQKATRTIQILCSEAKSSKQTTITSKIPATKRSMERFLFQVKALLSTSSGCTFWMGNLKHKDLMGQVVSSQAYVDDQNDDIDEDNVETVVDQHCSVASEEEREP